MTLSDLLMLWRRRDLRYASRRYGVPIEERAAILWWRGQEIDQLPPQDRATAFRVLHGGRSDAT